MGELFAILGVLHRWRSYMPACISIPSTILSTSSMKSLAHTMVLRTAFAFATCLGSWNETRRFFPLFYRPRF
jgi:hypothetical protein